MGLRACFDTVFNYFNFQILHFTIVKNIKLKDSQQLNFNITGTWHLAFALNSKTVEISEFN